MAVEIDGVEYFSAADVAKALGVSRQTLWRWSTSGKIPSGQRYRDRQLVFTRSEFDKIRDFAHRIEPVLRTQSQQTNLQPEPEGS